MDDVPVTRSHVAATNLRGVPAFAGTTNLSIRRHDAGRENGFEMFGALAIGVHQIFVGDAAQLPAQLAGRADGIELGALAHDGLNGIDMMPDQVRRHLVEIERVLR